MVSSNTCNKSKLSAISSMNNLLQTSLSIEDFMSSIQEFHKKVLIDSETLSTAQVLKYKDLNDVIKKLSSLVVDVKAKMALLRQECTWLKE